MSEHPPRTLQVELGFARSPRLEPDRILDAIRRRRPDADLVDPEPNGAVLVRYRRIGERHPTATQPLVNAITTPVAGLAGRDLTHSHWPEAAGIFADCRYSLMVTEFLGGEVTPATRLGAYQAALAAVIDATEPLATWWPGSQQALPPPIAAEQPLRGLVNIRTFAHRVDPDRALMDTLGLYQFGLPDLECHFRYLDRAMMATLLSNAVQFLVDGGRYDGVMRGLTAHQRWPVRRARSQAGPARTVLSIDPGPPFHIPPVR